MSKYLKRPTYHYADFAHSTAYRAHVLDVVGTIRRLERPGDQIIRKLAFDLGCGEGLVLTLLELCGFTPWGVEPDDTARAHAKSCGFDVLSSIEKVVLDKPGRIDLAFATALDVLEHVDDLEGTITWLAERFNRVYIAVPDREDPHAVRQHCEAEVRQLFGARGLKTQFHYTRHARHFMLFASPADA